jgi:hypothetical protein
LGLAVILWWFDVCWILLGLALQSGRLITQEEIQKLQAMEKAQELELNGYDDGMTAAVDIGDKDDVLPLPLALSLSLSYFLHGSLLFLHNLNLLGQNRWILLLILLVLFSPHCFSSTVQSR